MLNVGSVANVVTATLRKYQEMENDNTVTKEQKILAIQKELEEATALELPMMEQNLPIIGTITYTRYIDGIARYGYRYDPFICRSGSWWFGRLNGTLSGYL